MGIFPSGVLGPLGPAQGGIPRLTGKLDTFARRFYAEEYRQDLRRIMAMGIEEPDADEE